MTHHTEAERADCPVCGGKPFIRRSHDEDGMHWSHVECKGCGLRTRGKWVVSSSDECPIFFQEVWEEWPRRAPAAPAEALEKAKKYDHLFPYLCKTCVGFGLVDRRCQDDPLGAEPCPDCNAPAAPVPQGWPSAWRETIERAAEKVKDSCAYQLSDDLYAMLAAAPQPPEAAPVHMPEPVGYLNTHGTYERPEEHKEDLRCAQGKELEYLLKSRTAVYTDKQVRQLLAAHGIKGA